MEDFLEPRQIARLVRDAFQCAEYGIRDQIHCLTQESAYDWCALRSKIAAIPHRDSFKQSEKHERVKKWYSLEVDRVTIGSPLTIQNHNIILALISINMSTRKKTVSPKEQVTPHCCGLIFPAVSHLFPK
ncbi:hypothetical protein Ciccas_013927 [Cichlidogyrus casuarinus]|uniref:Uncharacterized protein n=1 Tax=Cichlidogyrus casuarinus TaxID=1844966 RepID=A0ABD2PMB7_9PLAT